MYAALLSCMLISCEKRSRIAANRMVSPAVLPAVSQDERKHRVIPFNTRASPPQKAQNKRG